MESDIYTVSNGGRTYNIRLEMMNIRRLSQMFQIPQESIYLLNRGNVAVFPDERGHFTAEDLGPPNGTFAVQDGAQVPDTSASQPFAFSSSNVTPRPSPLSGGQFMFRSSSTLIARNQRTHQFTRKIFRGFLQGKSISPCGSYHICLNSDTCNPIDVVRITKEVANVDTDLVLTDSSGFEIVDSVATRGIDYWKTPARKFFVVTREEHRALMLAKIPSRKRQAEEGHVEEVDTKLANIIKNAKRLWVVDDTAVRTIQDTFTCAICKNAIQDPVFTSACCQSILGCRECLTEPTVQENCPKCRSSDPIYTPVRGLGAVLSVLGPVFDMTLPVPLRDNPESIE